MKFYVKNENEILDINNLAIYARYYSIDSSPENTDAVYYLYGDRTKKENGIRLATFCGLFAKKEAEQLLNKIFDFFNKNPLGIFRI